MNTEQAEAGPSTPRTPPGTPPAKPRRRSWFGLVTSPFSSTAPTSSSVNSPRRKSFAEDETGHELTERSSTSSLSDPPHTPNGRLGSIRRSKGKEPESEQGEEVLTIDGQVETPNSVRSRRKKKWKSAGLDEEQGETVRLDDLSLRRGSSRSTLRSSQEAVTGPAIGKTPRQATANGYTQAKDIAVPEPEPPEPMSDIPKLEPALPTSQRRIVPSPRSSSLAIKTIGVPPDKSTPPLPTDRPLPALPLVTNIPTDIVITPSSPRKLQKPSRRTSTSMSDLRGRISIQETVSDSRSSSRSRKVISRKSSLIGLGLPRGVKSDEDISPPLPQKPQSVSSPHPSRSNSPTPRISFAEPDEEKERGRPETTKGSDKDKEAKRARSLSGIFSRSTSQPVTSKPGSVNGSNSGTPILQDEVEVLEKPDQGASDTGKMAGVLEWLGVRKSGKRRLSDAKATAEKEPVRDQREAGTSDMEKAGSLEEIVKGDSSRNSTLRADDSRRPHFRDISPSTTIKPVDDRRRSSSATRPRTSEDRTASGPITIAPNRSALSSKVSLGLSVSDLPTPPHPGIHDSFVSSPKSETEEMFFDPPSAPWVDTIEQLPSKGSNAVAAGNDILASQVANKPGRDGRLRSWSDAPTRSSAPAAQEARGPSGSSDRLPAQVAPLPSLSSRPKLGNRSHSGNSALIEKMKGVFAKSTSSRNRARSRSLLPPDSAGDKGVNEFGGLPAVRSRAGTTSTASSQWSPSMAPNATLLDLHHGSGHTTNLDEAAGEFPRPSFSSTARSTPPSSYHPMTDSPVGDQSHPIPSTASRSAAPTRSRGRASTVSFASSAPQTTFIPPPSPSLFPVAATPPRRRPSAIQRFSSGLLGTSAPSSPKGSLFPLPPRSSGSTFSSASGVTGAIDDVGSTGTIATSQMMSPGTSPRPSTGSMVPKHDDLKVGTVPEDGETEAAWLERIMLVVGRAEIAGVLATSGDAFHTRALELYMESFDFTHHALDVALRKLLLEMSLPKETQQIDRVVEAFAKRYEACEPGLFGSKDNTYVLAFSMMMLHTDAFNRNNKNKMSKSDYVRNTRMEGVSPITLEAFYDNITYTPFVHLDDPHQGDPAEIISPTQTMRSSGSRSRSGSDAVYPTPPSTTSPVLSTPVTPISALPSTALSTPRTASSSLKPDIYALMSGNLLSTLRVDVEQHIPARSPFSCLGTESALEVDRLQHAFVTAGIMRIGGDSPSKRRPASARKGMVSEGEEGEVSLRVTKVGLLSRKDDAADSSARKTSRKWRSWSVILTGSQLLFFKDPVWALTLQQQLHADGVKRDDRGQILLPRVAKFVPDEVFPLKDAVAVLDRKLLGQSNTFRFHLAHRAYLVQASDEADMNGWINLINYAAAFKSSGIRMRAGNIRRDQALLAGAAAASSFEREVKSLGAASENGAHAKKTFGKAMEPPAAPIPIVPNSSESHPTSILSVRRSTDSRQSDTSMSPVSGKNVLSSMESAESIGKDDGEQLGDVFNAVKAELAAGRGAAGAIVAEARSSCSRPTSPGRTSVKPALKVKIPSSQAVRTTAIESSLRDLSGKLDAAHSRLDVHLTQARNLAILTPFQRTTRDRISSAIPPLASLIRTERLIIAKLDIWIRILQADLDREERNWAVTRHVALQAAERSLKMPGGVRAVVEAVQEGEKEGMGTIVPSLSLPAGLPAGEGEEGVAEQDDKEVLQEDEDADKKEEEGSGSDSLGTTPHELPVLIRHTSDEALGPVVGVERPGFRRHVSASSLLRREA